MKLLQVLRASFSLPVCVVGNCLSSRKANAGTLHAGSRTIILLGGRHVDALAVYRLARHLRRFSVPSVSSALVAFNRIFNRAYVSLAAELADEALVGYGGSGVVVEAGAYVGPGSLLCQNVTVEKNARIGRNVLVGAGAFICAGVQVGDDARIGANAVVQQDVPVGARVAGVPAECL